ncbi:hypothetical protein EMCG_07466 [[Emmonsia] crescens]|uniref:Uncharacterized protein n=1 Tax=[Emmonsia] crescens TaxID=73230 RepID=A0A0G2I9B9_9EURO|nr:hypothetical protein EMCG_07466 [Emmonsia crescens UAMH 3008]
MAGLSEELNLPLKSVMEHDEIDQFNPSQLVSLISYTERLPLYENEKAIFHQLSSLWSLAKTIQRCLLPSRSSHHRCSRP